MLLVLFHSFRSSFYDRSTASSKVRSSASAFNLQYSLLSLRSLNSCLHLLPHLPVTFISPSIFPSITCFRRPIQVSSIFMRIGFFSLRQPRGKRATINTNIHVVCVFTPRWLVQLLDPEDEGTMVLQKAPDYQSTSRTNTKDLNVRQHRCQKLRPCNAEHDCHVINTFTAVGSSAGWCQLITHAHTGDVQPVPALVPEKFNDCSVNVLKWPALNDSHVSRIAA